MKVLSFLILLLMVTIGNINSAQATPATEIVEAISIDLDGEESEDYIIVYTINGHTYAVIIPHFVDCGLIREYAPLVGITIVDCGAAGDQPYSLPAGTTMVSEAQALNDFQLGDWPTE